MGSGAEDDSFTANLRLPGSDQMTQCRDLRNHSTRGIAGAAEYDCATWVACRDGIKHFGQSRRGGCLARNNEIRQDDPCYVRILEVGPSLHFGGRTPQADQLAVDVPGVDWDSLTLEERVGGWVSHWLPSDERLV